MVIKHQGHCCALCQLQCNDETSIEELAWHLTKLKNESKLVWNIHDRASGERAVYVIATPFELNLKSNLKKLGFKKITSFNRRNGYAQVGSLEMYFLKF